MIYKRTILILLLILTYTLMYSQISPGDLAEPHAHLEGLSNCTLCHTLGDKVTNEKCLDCHTLFKSRVDAGLGYHSSAQVAGKSCVSCHNDHHGRKFKIIRFEADTFNHQLTGYKLEGAHARINCADCHNNNYITDQKVREKKYTYLGLDTQCISCHTDVHQNTLSTNCNDCHNMEDFIPASLFDHDQSKYPLTGQHIDVDCQLCHPVQKKNGADFQLFKGIEFNNCNSCHKDVHDNKFGQDCKSCHSVESFHQIRNVNSFDHSKTDYKLEGLHLAVDCKNCHSESYTEPLAFNRCMDCHNDYHRGQLVSQSKVIDCSDCHSVFGFSGSSYTIEKHQESHFPLIGAHEATPCFICHKKEERWEFRNIGVNCVDCHTDIHLGAINTQFYPESDCRTCHTERYWGDVLFDHSQTSFNLLGKHVEVSCRNCHFNPSEGGNFEQVFDGLSTDCVNCHDDTHVNQFDVDGFTDCYICHDFNNWKADKFNHDKTNFPLDGKHQYLDCNLCHKEIVKNDIRFIEYKIPQYRCEDCH